MRAVALADERVRSLLARDFVAGWHNIAREDYVGRSHGYTCDQPAVGTTNGAGARNVQIFVLSASGVVLHALPGFWHPDDLAQELELATTLHALWRDRSRGASAKREMYSRLQLAALRTHGPATFARSTWQGFDAAAERERREREPRDTFLSTAQGTTGDTLKPINQLVHERLAERPFVPFQRFDVEAFADYGRDYYDNNAKLGRGVQFGTEGYMQSQKRQAERQRARAAAKGGEAEPDREEPPNAAPTSRPSVPRPQKPRR